MKQSLLISARLNLSWESQLSIHAPSQFLQEHWRQLLPEWNQPIASVLLYLQASPVSLCDRTPKTEAIKQQLRQSFLQKAERWRQQILQAGYHAEAFDPRDGIPTHSQAGAYTLDDVAVAAQLLGWPSQNQNECKLLCHPDWHTAVFPSTLLSSAPPEILQTILSQTEQGSLPLHSQRL